MNQKWQHVPPCGIPPRGGGVPLRQYPEETTGHIASSVVSPLSGDRHLYSEFGINIVGILMRLSFRVSPENVVRRPRLRPRATQPPE